MQGYLGKALVVDLTSRRLEIEELPEELCRSYIGGYGIGARVLYDRQRREVDALGADNILGFVTGPLTGTAAPFGNRYTVVAKSPLTGTWGDANSGGDFGPHLKFAGFDAIFFSGAASSPVYLAVIDGRAELRDASGLWGLDSYAVEEKLRRDMGTSARVACIGPSGEQRSLISCVINNRGRAAGRSGLGAVMGGKLLKAVAVIGTGTVPVAHEEMLLDARRRYLDGVKGKGWWQRFADYGTAGATASNAMNGDSPVKNWAGSGEVDFREARAISDQAVVAKQRRRWGCWHCPLVCGAEMEAGTGEYEYVANVHRPEYETLCTFGTMCLNSNLDSIIKANDICNRFGLDTISAGAAVAFTIECFENGVLTAADTGGLELRWGQHRAIVEVTQQMAERRSFGAVLADGVKLAAERIGRGAERFAIHVHGQEPGMHDPKWDPPSMTKYIMDATPGRHTQMHGRGRLQMHFVNCAGLCMFGYFGGNPQLLADYMTAVTGEERSVEELMLAAERVATLRHCFNLREGLNPLDFKVPDRMAGRPPLEAGPLKGVSIDVEGQIAAFLKEMEWDEKTAVPSRAKLEHLGLADVARELHGA